jgi:hypothetical protein
MCVLSFFRLIRYFHGKLVVDLFFPTTALDVQARDPASIEKPQIVDIRVKYWPA